eukprot:3489909-Rhodomonas_salina.2
MVLQRPGRSSTRHARSVLDIGQHGRRQISVLGNPVRVAGLLPSPGSSVRYVSTGHRLACA